MKKVLLLSTLALEQISSRIMPKNDDRVRRDLEILGLELSASEGMDDTLVVKALNREL